MHNDLPHLPAVGNVIIKACVNHLRENRLLHTHTALTYTYIYASNYNFQLRKLRFLKDPFCSGYFQCKMRTLP